MNTINFGELHGNIRERNEQVRILRAKIPDMLDLDDKGTKPIIAPEHKQRALEVAKKLKSLREKNKTDAAILEKAQEISGCCNIPLNEFHQFALSIPFFEKQITELEERIKGHKKRDPKKFAAEKDSSVSRIGQDIQKLEQARISLKNHQDAKVAVEVLLKEVEQQEAE